MLEDFTRSVVSKWQHILRTRKITAILGFSFQLLGVAVRFILIVKYRHALIFISFEWTVFLKSDGLDFLQTFK